MTAALTMACTSDLAGLVRGKGFSTADLDGKIDRGLGWTPTNALITCFDTIAESPYGALGDMVLWPDPDTLAQCDLPGGRSMSFLMGDISDLDGGPWECCTRNILKQALTRFTEVSGLELRATFEHEFMLSGGSGTRAFSLQGFAEAQPFADALFTALDGAGITPDSFLREYGPDQYEVTLPPVGALRAADEAVVLREITRATATAMGRAVTFSPLVGPEVVGNGVHVHFSLWTTSGQPVTHHPEGQNGLSAPASAFIAGVLRHLNAVCALTAPSAISALRLVPHRWSAAYNNLGAQDREAAIRICPVSAKDPEARARQFNFEFRAADAAASPYLTLASIVAAGTLGLAEGLQAPAATEKDLSLLSERDLTERGLKRVPESLTAALEAFAADTALRGVFPGRFADIYLAHKKGEWAHVADMTEEQRFAEYRAMY
ncbi:MAG: glutamine synthetase family protein [Jannaschia sp.]